MVSGSLIVIYPDGHKQLFPLGIRGIRIGGAHDNDIVISGPGVLPYHAMISCERHDMLVIYISSAALPHRTRTAASLPQALRPGAIVPIGQYMLTYQVVELNTSRKIEPIARQEPVDDKSPTAITNATDIKTGQRQPATPLLHRWLARSARPKPRQPSPLVRSVVLS